MNPVTGLGERAVPFSLCEPLLNSVASHKKFVLESVAAPGRDRRLRVRR